MKILFILNDAPYGLERNYNALRLASSLSKKNIELKVFLFSDAVLCAKKDQSVPQGYYNIETMLKNIINHHTEVGLCSSCMNAHGMKDEEMIAGTKRSSMEGLTDWTIWSDKIIVF